MKLKNVSLAVEEWDFARCPEEEIEHCHLYEFARSNSGCIERIAEHRPKSVDLTFDELWPSNPVGLLMDKTPYSGRFFPYCPEWPKIPYLGISEKERKRRQEYVPKRVNGVGIHETDLEEILMDFDSSNDPKEPFCIWNCQRLQEDGCETVAFEINWSQNNSELLRQFGAWLRRQREFNGIKEKEERGRGSELAKLKNELKALGAFRLLHIMGYSDARDYSAEQGIMRSPLYHEQSRWINAHKRAGEIIARFSISGHYG